MTKLYKTSLLALLAASLVWLAGCNKLRARDQLNKGVTAFKSSQFNEAIDHFKQAVELDPTLINAKLYLATAYESQFVPGAPSSDNLRIGDEAINEFKDVLKTKPTNTNAVASIALLYFNMNKFEHARKWYNQYMQLAPNDPTPHYSIGVIDWNETYRPRMELRAKMGISNPDLPMVGKRAPRKVVEACEDLSKVNMPKIEEGLASLNKALQLRPNYADAMAYINLLYREKADVECTNQSARKADLTLANDWVNKSMAARRAEVMKQAAAGNNGITVQ